MALIVCIVGGLAAYGASADNGTCSPAPGIVECTTTTLSVSPASPMAGQQLTFTATVTDTVAGGFGAPHGTVNFFANGIQIAAGVTLVPGSGASSTATFQTGLGSSDYTVTATYNSDSTNDWAASTSAPFGLTVGGVTYHDTTTSLQADNSTVNTGTPITFSAHVAVTDGSGLIPAGTVTFRDKNDPNQPVLLGATTLDANGNASLTTALGPGTHTILAIYTGPKDSTFNSSTSPELTVSVNAPQQAVGTATALVSDRSSITAGGTVNFTAHVTLAGSNSVVTSGTVIFRSDQSTVPLGSSTLDGNGNATIGYSSFGASANITAYYQGVAGQFLPSTSLPLGLTVVAPPHATSLTLLNQPLTATQGSTVSLSARLFDTTLGTAVPDGESVAISFGQHESCTGTTSGGVVTCSVYVSDPQGVYTVNLSFAGDTAQNLAGSTGTGSITVSAGTKTPTTLTYLGDSSDLPGATATLSAKLTDPLNAPVGGKLLSFVLGTHSCSATTASSGIATCTVTLAANETPGPLSLSVTFDASSDPLFIGSSISPAFTVLKRPTTLAFTSDNPTFGTVNSTVTLKGTIVDTLTGTPISNEPVTLTMSGTGGSLSCAGTSDSTGHVSCPVTLTLPVGQYALSLAFAGDATYASSTGHDGLFSITRPSSLALTAPASAAYGDTITVGGVLTDPSLQPAAPIAGRLVTFTFGSLASQTCTGTTNASGAVSCQIQLLQKPSTTPGTLTGTFTGDATYGAATATKQITVTKRTLVLGLTAPAVALQGAPVTLTATLGNVVAGDAPTLPIGFGFDTRTPCAVVPTSTTVASCAFSTTGLMGPTTGTASFAGNDYYNPATARNTTTIVYAPAPGTGEFVVGNLNSAVGTAVTFWGSQWSRLNSLSGGPAPDEFKGFASNATTLACGITWTAGPGDSQKPPSGPLPAYLGVLVSSAIGKSGSTIYGNSVGVVVVRTNSGYDDDPGHAGTGTIVATVCGQTSAPPPLPTTLTYTGDTSVNSGGTATLKAKLLDSNGQPVVGRTVQLRLDSQTACTGTTGGDGQASCQSSVPVVTATRTYSVYLTFAGDSMYGASSGTGTVTVKANGGGLHYESLLADPSVAAGATVSPAQVLTIVAMDDSPISGMTVTIDGQSVPVLLSPTSGWPSNYVDNNGGSRSNRYQMLAAFSAPLTLGAHTIQVTAYDSDGDVDVWSWPITVSGTVNGPNKPPTPPCTLLSWLLVWFRQFGCR
ncbi:MAG: Ig-like domain repeat protein [Actinobacteria bacterium]|nr:Ig-like domain repeat protein [Actinomycetota bacterium]